VSKTTTPAKGRKTQKSRRDKYGMTAKDWARLDAMTADEVLVAARSDPDALPLEDRAPGSLGPPRHLSLVKRIRWKLRMSQSEFAAAFRIPLGTLRDWEQHRREPDQAAQAYLEVIAAKPDAVRKVLAKRAA
jgi:putative transcriptional regulator